MDQVLLLTGEILHHPKWPKHWQVQGYIGIMDKKMEATGIIGIIGNMGFYRENGKENGNYSSTIGVM